MTHPQKPPLLLIVPALIVHVTFWVLTWRDLSRRTDAEVRGSRVLWRIASALNSLGSLGYWTLGRRRH